MRPNPPKATTQLDMKRKYERIYIGMWPRGTHWHITSSENRKFDPAKFPSLESAMECALKYSSKNNVFVNLPQRAAKRMTPLRFGD